MNTQGPSTFDFAGLRINEGPLPSRASGEPTRGEVIRAKNMAVGSGRKRCRQGKICSATCIAMTKYCLVDFPIPMQRDLRRMAIFLVKRNKFRAGSREDLVTGAAIRQQAGAMKIKEGPAETIGRGKDKLTKPRLEFKQDPIRSKRQALPFKEIQDLIKRRDLLGDAEFDREAMKLLQKDVFGRGLRLRRNELEMLFDALPKSTQDSMMASGKATGKWWAGKDENGNDVFSKNPTRERGLAVYDMWLRQGGTSAYAGRGSKVWAPQDLDVEHLRPMTKGGADSPSNWVLARAGAQQKRNVTDLGKWIDSLPKNEAEYRQYLSDHRSKKSAKRTKDAVTKALDPKQFTDKEVFSWGGEKSGKAFGKKTLFTSEFQPIVNVNRGAGRASSGPPQPFAKGIALIAKNQGAEVAEPVVYKLRDIWNKQLIENKSITPQEAFRQMVDAVQSKLSPEQNSLFGPAAEAWAQSRDVKSYGFL